MDAIYGNVVIFNAPRNGCGNRFCNVHARSSSVLTNSMLNIIRRANRKHD
jgi:hypothetical protein